MLKVRFAKSAGAEINETESSLPTRLRYTPLFALSASALAEGEGDGEGDEEAPEFEDGSGDGVASGTFVAYATHRPFGVRP